VAAPAMWRWLWDDTPWNSRKRPPYWNSASGFDCDHITAVDMSLCTSLRNFIQIGPTSAETRAQLLPRMADRLCLHRRCVEYLATGNFYLLA